MTVGRFSGFFSNSRSMRDPNLPARRMAGGGSNRTAVRVSVAVSLRNGETPSTASYRVTPSENRSPPGAVVPRARSGATYSIDPSNAPVTVSVVSSRCTAIRSR